MVFSVSVLINETPEINCTPDVAKNPSNSQRNPNKLVYKLCIMICRLKMEQALDSLLTTL